MGPRNHVLALSSFTGKISPRMTLITLMNHKSESPALHAGIYVIEIGAPAHRLYSA
jgi:hypothetical protein